MWDKINKNSKKLSSSLKKLSFTISTAESCTGGLLSAAIINNAGASSIFEKGFITYSNKSKKEILNVDNDILINYGAVSKETCLNMLKNVIKKSKSNIGVSITGIAGPGGGSELKPVGLVWIGYGTIENYYANSYVFKGDRLGIRMHSTLQSLINVNKFLKNNHL